LKLAGLNILVFLSVFFVALSVSRGYLAVNFSGDSVYPVTYENFYVSNSEKELNNRECGNASDLSDRHRLRWVFWQLKSSLYDVAKNTFGYSGVGATFSLLHALIVTLTFWFTNKIVLLIRGIILKSQELTVLTSDENDSADLFINVFVFLALFLYTFNGQVGEYTYSIIEGFFVSLAVYSAFRNKVLLFSIVVSLAVLNRESGFVLIAVWFIVNGVYRDNIFKNSFILVPCCVFMVANYDLAHCLVRENFLISSRPLLGQLTFHIFFDGVWGVVRGGVAIVFNYGVFIIPSVLAYIWVRKNVVSISLIIKRIMYIIGLYVLVFLIATPLNHMSVKFIIVPLVSTVLSVCMVCLFEKKLSRLE